MFDTNIHTSYNYINIYNIDGKKNSVILNKESGGINLHKNWNGSGISKLYVIKQLHEENLNT